MFVEFEDEANNKILVNADKVLWVSTPPGSVGIYSLILGTQIVFDQRGQAVSVPSYVNVRGTRNEVYSKLRGSFVPVSALAAEAN